MRQPAQRQRYFNVERWRASRDLRVDIAHIVAALAILAGIAALDVDPKTPATAHTSLPAVR